MTDKKYAVRARNIYKVYPNEIKALNGVSLNVDYGEVLVIIGASGSGKSTFLRTLNRLEEINSGSIEVLGTDIFNKKTKPTKLRTKIGMVFQHFNLFPHLTVMENITIGQIKVKKVNKKDAVDLATVLLKKVGIVEKADVYPEQLSGGQQQRVAIARALAMKPQLMLFDEATSALDPEMIGEVLDVMEKVAKEGMTMIVVTHEMDFAKAAADRIAFMNQGKITEIATPEEILANDNNPQLKQFLNKIH
ncbi:MAG: amino acid ABC transporter ATP-binding protein [Epsilonproteobacteria bacterium]|nr:amino acid ABC transporter ATP-binding protein [Campylobacterota bacterium]